MLLFITLFLFFCEKHQISPYSEAWPPQPNSAPILQDTLFSGTKYQQTAVGARRRGIDPSEKPQGQPNLKSKESNHYHLKNSNQGGSQPQRSSPATQKTPKRSQPTSSLLFEIAALTIIQDTIQAVLHAIQLSLAVRSLGDGSLKVTQILQNVA